MKRFTLIIAAVFAVFGLCAPALAVTNGASYHAVEDVVASLSAGLIAKSAIFALMAVGIGVVLYRCRRITPAAAAVLLLSGAIWSAFGQTPFRDSLTLNAGSGTYTWTGGVYRGVSTAWKVEHILIPYVAGSTVTVHYVNGGATNLLGTKIPSATDTTLIVTNMPWAFHSDQLLFSSNDTNSITPKVIGQEK